MKKIKSPFEILLWCKNNPMQEYIWFNGYKERYNDKKQCFECFSQNEWKRMSVMY